MRLLVTGGAGFIGSHTVDLLLQRGYEVRVLDALRPPVHEPGVKPAYLPDDVEFIHGDVRDKDAMARALDGIDAVFHLAAYQDYLPDFSTFAFINDGGTAMLYEVIVEYKLPVQKVVLASSQAVYGEGKYTCPDHGVKHPDLRAEGQLAHRQWEPVCPTCGAPMSPAWTDESHVNPASQYAVSKYAQELYGLTLGKRYQIPTVAMRYSITQGPRQSFRNAYSGICRIFAQRLLNDQPPVAYEDGNQLRDYVYVGDVARANLLVLEDERANYEAFNVGGGKTTTVLEYAHLMAGMLSKKLAPEIPGKFRFGDTRHIFSAISKIRGLGWEPRTSLQETIQLYLNWIQKQPGVRDYYSESEKRMEALGTLRSATS